MPELPEVEAVCRKLRRQIVGARIGAARVLRCGTRRLQQQAPGRSIQAVERRGKNILLPLSGGVTIRAHLRMSGNLYVIPDVRLRSPSTRVYFELEDGRGLVLEDLRALATMDLHSTAEVDRLVADLGVEPLSEDFTTKWLLGAARWCRKPAKLFLMDQSRLAGLGNIYAAEALFRARIHPTRQVCRLRKREFEALRRSIVAVLRDAIESACNGYTGPGGFQEAESFPLAVYGREGEPCRVCSCRIRRIVQNGRSTYYCPGCQR